MIWLLIFVLTAAVLFGLWRIAAWSSVRKPRRTVFICAMLVAVAQLALACYGLLLNESPTFRSNLLVDGRLLYAALPIFVLFPFAAAVLVPRALDRIDSGEQLAHFGGFAMSLVALIAAPATAVILGCSIAGACF